MQQQGLRELIPILREVLLWVKCYQSASHTTEKSFVGGKVDLCVNFTVVLFLKMATANSACSNSHPAQSAAPA